MDQQKTGSNLPDLSLLMETGAVPQIKARQAAVSVLFLYKKKDQKELSNLSLSIFISGQNFWPEEKLKVSGRSFQRAAGSGAEPRGYLRNHERTGTQKPAPCSERSRGRAFYRLFSFQRFHAETLTRTA